MIRGIRPLLGATRCPFNVSCGNYAISMLHEEPLIKALCAILQRLVSCHPFYNSYRNRLG